MVVIPNLNKVLNLISLVKRAHNAITVKRAQNAHSNVQITSNNLIYEPNNSLPANSSKRL